MDLLSHEGGRLILLILAGLGFMLQWDNLAEAIREARKGGGNSSSRDEPPPPGEAV